MEYRAKNAILEETCDMGALHFEYTAVLVLSNLPSAVLQTRQLLKLFASQLQQWNMKYRWINFSKFSVNLLGKHYQAAYEESRRRLQAVTAARTQDTEILFHKALSQSPK